MKPCPRSSSILFASGLFLSRTALVSSHPGVSQSAECTRHSECPSRGDMCTSDMDDILSNRPKFNFQCNKAGTQYTHIECPKWICCHKPTFSGGSLVLCKNVIEEKIDIVNVIDVNNSPKFGGGSGSGGMLYNADYSTASGLSKELKHDDDFLKDFLSYVDDGLVDIATNARAPSVALAASSSVPSQRGSADDILNQPDLSTPLIQDILATPSSKPQFSFSPPSPAPSNSPVDTSFGPIKQSLMDMATDCHPELCLLGQSQQAAIVASPTMAVSDILNHSQASQTGLLNGLDYSFGLPGRNVQTGSTQEATATATAGSLSSINDDDLRHFFNMPALSGPTTLQTQAATTTCTEGDGATSSDSFWSLPTGDGIFSPNSHRLVIEEEHPSSGYEQPHIKEKPIISEPRPDGSPGRIEENVIIEQPQGGLNFNQADEEFLTQIIRAAQQQVEASGQGTVERLGNGLLYTPTSSHSSDNDDSGTAARHPAQASNVNGAAGHLQDDESDIDDAFAALRDIGVQSPSSTSVSSVANGDDHDAGMNSGGGNDGSGDDSFFSDGGFQPTTNKQGSRVSG